jgi:hypothetical protein
MFRKSFLLTIILFSGFFGSRADILVQTTNVTAVPGTEFTIPIIISGASEDGTPIGSANIVFTFDSTAVKFVQFLNFNPLTPQNQWFFSGNNNTGIVAANWLEPNLGTVALPDGTTLYQVKFKAKAGSCAFTFITYEFTDADYNEIPASAINGSYASLQQVTFQVNMRDQAISPQGVFLAGSFNGWSTTATQMTAGDSTVYSVQLPLIADSSYLYRFVNGNTAGGLETVPADCGVSYSGGTARQILTGANDIILNKVCFAECDTCPPQAMITFRVDMSEQNVSPNGVHLAGDFNNWNPNATLLSNLGSDIFGVTLPLVIGSGVQYRFVNGNTTSDFEIVPSQCGVPAGGGLFNRYLTVPENDSTLIAVCFSNCSECLTVVTVTFKVDMKEEIISPNGVHLAGSFNNFNPNAITMTNQGNDVFIASVDLFEGDNITYRYVNGNTTAGFEVVPAECGQNNGSGTYNRFLTVPDANTVLDEVCFGECADCQQQLWEKDVTFKVDMNKTDISPDGVHLAGTFNAWDPSSIQMIHLGNNIYSTTLTLTQSDVHQYRFVNGNTAEEYENVPAECGFEGESGGLERQVTIPSNDTVLDPICYSECAVCQTYQVTVSVDMMFQTVSVFGVHIVGNFNDWNAEDHEMASSGTSIYETTLEVYEGDTLEYRFVNGNQVADIETVPADCGWLYNGSDYCRFIVPDSDTVLTSLCYEMCIPCNVGIDEKQAVPVIGYPYPNPASRQLTLPVYLPEKSEIDISFISIFGGVEHLVHAGYGAGNQDIKLDVSTIPAGLTLLRVIINDGSASMEFNSKILITK